MSERHISISFATAASVNLADDDALLEIMQRAAFVASFLASRRP